MKIDLKGLYLLVALGMAMTGGAVSPAVAAEISGTVTGPDGIARLEGIQATAFLWMGGYFEQVAAVQTGPDGMYALGGLSAGRYQVRFDDWQNGSYRSEVYDDAAELYFGEDVVLGAGDSATGIDASLAVAGKISGVVTGVGGTPPLSGIHVAVYRWNGMDWEPMWAGNTDDEGSYVVGGLPAGVHRVGFEDPRGSFLNEFHVDAADVYSGAEVVVATGETTAGIDAELVAAAKISGTVTRQDGGAPLTGIRAEAYRRDAFGWDRVAGVDTDDRGVYLLAGLPADTYRVRFWHYDYIDEAYEDASDLDSGRDVTVKGGEIATGIDAMLAHVNSAGVAGVRRSDADNLEIIFTGTTGMNYILQEAAALTGVWNDVGAPVRALAGTNALPCSAFVPPTFWRVRLLP